MHAYLSNRAARAGHELARVAWVKGGPAVTTPFVELPGLITARCVKDAHGSYLAITSHGDPSGSRVGEIPGDVVVGGQLLRDWGCT